MSVVGVAELMRKGALLLPLAQPSIELDESFLVDVLPASSRWKVVDLNDSDAERFRTLVQLLQVIPSYCAHPMRFELWLVARVVLVCLNWLLLVVGDHTEVRCVC
ncbi:hypothetical protein A5N78_04755 [Prescottella equi]|nr:hypothetical protein A5N78_04755 [Prescottella equi]ORM17802.1 hypothetical protein A5N70_11330 [Prescottella equi]